MALAAPKRGQIIWLDFDPTQGHEQRGHRPALVLSHQEFNRATELCIVCAMTTSPKDWPYKVEIEPGSYALADQIRTIDWKARAWKPKGSVDDDVLETILEVMDRLLR